MSQRQTVIGACAQVIYEGFLKYNQNVQRITDRAQQRFERRDWKGQYEDIRERIEIYETMVNRVKRNLSTQLGNDVNNHDFWQNLRTYFGERVVDVPDAGFMKTFFNSITRRIFGTVGTDSKVEFISPAADEGTASFESLSMRRYPCWGDLDAVFRRILSDFTFRVGYRDVARDSKYFSDQLLDHARNQPEQGYQFLRFEFIDSTFFQASRAYLVGRVLFPNKSAPIVLALANSGQGIVLDAVLLDAEDISVVFSYTRSYYFANPTSVVAAAHFLHSILPRKPIDEIYTVFGRLRQGKTERYRAFANHLAETSDSFVHAAGDTGLVMIVFTLPSYNLVFKVIRNIFGHPKTVTREEVEEKYKLVSLHDHAGRLIDTQEFLNLKLPLERFSPELLADLTTHASKTVSIHEDDLLFKQVYVERRVVPLNLYIRDASRLHAEHAILDYGRAIKDLADTNIFPGDLLLKNFGVTAHRRVVFYDYDEVALVTECRFREIPDMDDEFDLMHAGGHIFVHDNDIFPEEFIKFLGMDENLRQSFLEVHGDLLTADYWRERKQARLDGDISQVVPYSGGRGFEAT